MVFDWSSCQTKKNLICGGLDGGVGNQTRSVLSTVAEVQIVSCVLNLFDRLSRSLKLNLLHSSRFQISSCKSCFVNSIPDFLQFQDTFRMLSFKFKSMQLFPCHTFSTAISNSQYQRKDDKQLQNHWRSKVQNEHPDHKVDIRLTSRCSSQDPHNVETSCHIGKLLNQTEPELSRVSHSHRPVTCFAPCVLSWKVNWLRIYSKV